MVDFHVAMFSLRGGVVFRVKPPTVGGKDSTTIYEPYETLRTLKLLSVSRGAIGNLVGNIMPWKIDEPQEKLKILKLKHDDVLSS